MKKKTKTYLLSSMQKFKVPSDSIWSRLKVFYDTHAIDLDPFEYT